MQPQPLPWTGLAWLTCPESQTRTEDPGRVSSREAGTPPPHPCQGSGTITPFHTLPPLHCPEALPRTRAHCSSTSDTLALPDFTAAQESGWGLSAPFAEKKLKARPHSEAGGRGQLSPRERMGVAFRRAEVFPFLTVSCSPTSPLFVEGCQVCPGGIPQPPPHALYGYIQFTQWTYKTGSSVRCQGALWEESIGFGEEGSFQEDVEFDPEPLGFAEKRSEEGFVVRRTAEVKVASDRERGGKRSCLCPEEPRTQTFKAPTRVGRAEPWLEAWSFPLHPEE